MGQAKQRGTKEQRHAHAQAQALEKMDENVNYLVNDWNLDREKVLNHFKNDAQSVNKFCDDLRIGCIKYPSLSLKFKEDRLLVSTTHPIYLD